MQLGLSQEYRDSSLVLAANRGYERLRMTNLKGMSKENDCVLRTPAGFSQALIKIYTPCNLPNLFSCQISSSPVFTGCPPRRVWIVPTSGCATPQSSNPMFGAKLLNRDTESVVALTPNIELVVSRSSLVVGASALADDERPMTNDGFSGGADRDRTGGLLVANQALSQLSYSPNPVVRLWSFVVRKKQRPRTHDQRLIVVGLGRVELPTSSLSGMRSSQLSYRPGDLLQIRSLNHNIGSPATSR
jgi:hypothetical protein